ncbi:hypothetical protein OAV81_02850 [Candidatus Thioglobus sp.]|jgi:acetyltransferase-like isoleucine patch superfamily enzyme|nr:hypothetical protein [Candidatus Thioglobus sp.]
MDISRMQNRLQRIAHYFIESIIRNISGGVGQKIRYVYYKKRFVKCGKDVKIGIGVVLQGCEFMEIGNNVWIDDYCIIIAGETGEMSDREVIKIRNKSFSGEEGYVYIGNNIHFAPFCIIHGYGGVEIKDYVGFSSGVKLYSMSNHYKSMKNTSMVTYTNPNVKDKPVVFVKSPIVINSNVLVSLNAIILVGEVGKNSFISPASVVTMNIPENSVAEGNPARKIKNRFDDY